MAKQTPPEFTDEDVKRFTIEFARRLIKHVPDLSPYMPAGTDLSGLTRPPASTLLPQMLQALWHGPGTWSWTTLTTTAKMFGYGPK